MYHNSSDHNCSVFHRRGLVGDLLIHNIYKFFELIPVADLRMTQRFTVNTRGREQGFTVEPPSARELVGSICATEVRVIFLFPPAPRRRILLKACSGASHFTWVTLQQSRRNLFQALQMFSYIRFSLAAPAEHSKADKN